MSPYFRRLVFLIALVLVGYSQALSAQTATTTSLSLLSGSAPVTTVPAGTMITMSATVTGSAAPITGGTIYFCDSVNKNCAISPIATAHVINGAATFKTVLAIGSYSFTAMYVPIAGFGASTSSAVTLTVPSSAAPTFSPSPSMTATYSPYDGGNYSLFAPLAAPTAVAPTGTITVTDITAGTQLSSHPVTNMYVAPNSLTLGAHLSGDSRGACTAVTGDFNGDGHPDIAIGSGCKSADGLNSPTALQIMLGNGDGTFTAGPAVPAAMTNTNVTALAVGDFNNDGTLDLIAADNQVSGTTSTPHLYLLANDGAAHFTATQIGQNCTASALMTSDLNRDGNLDFVASCITPPNSNPYIYVFLSDGAGGFTPTNTNLWPSTGGFEGPDNPQTGFAIADFNNDGYPDLVSGSNFDVIVSLNTGTGKDFTQVVVSQSISPTDAFITGDFNGDGNADFMVYCSLQGHAWSNGMNIFPFYGDGHGGFTSGNMGSTSGYWPGLAGTAISVADFDHDGTPEMAYSIGSPYSDGIYVTKGGVKAQFPQYLNVNNLAAPIADFNGDGIPDIAVAISASDGADIYTMTDAASAIGAFGVYVLGTGTHDIAVSYSGDAIYPAVTNHFSVTAGRAPTTLNMSASSNPEFIGNPVTITASLTPYKITVGSNTFSTDGQTVTFSSGGTTLGTATLANGIATLNLPSLPLGSTTITGSYAGDSTFAPVPASVLTVVIKAPTAPTTNPTSLNFGAKNLDTSSSIPVTFTNTATGPLTISSIVATGSGLTQTNNCGATLAASASCTISVTFAPTTVGTISGALTINTNAATPTTTVALNAQGIIFVTPQLTASPTSTSIGNQVTLTVTVPATTHGLSTNGMSVSFYGNSGLLNTATVTNGVATIHVTNLPAGSNQIYGQFNGDGNNFSTTTSNTVTVTITNITPPTTSTNAINFAPVGIGSSISQTITFTNTDTVSSLNIASVQISNGFSLANHCGATLAPTASCTATVTFAPTAAATVTGTLTFTTNANTPTRTVSLSGSGVVPTLQLSAAPAPAPIGAPVTLTATLAPYSAGSLSTNGKTVNFSSGSTQLGIGTLTNGVAALSVTSLPLGSDAVTATFTGDADFASVTSSPTTVTITTPPPPTVNPTSVNFGAIHQGFSTTSTVSFTNTSTGPLTIASIVATGSGFTQTNNCGSTLTASANCTVTLTFTPTTGAAATGSLAITTNASSPITTVPLSGSGIAPVLYLTASPTTTAIGTQVALTATLAPYINGNLTTNGKTVSFVSGSTTLGTATLNNGSALLNLTNLPIGSNSIVATFTGDATFPTATSSPVVITITGPTAPTVTPSSIDFGTVTLGNSVSQKVTLTNTAATPLTITAVQVSGGFTQTNTCGNLAVSASCTATVTFAPTTASAATGTLTFTTTAVTSTTTVSLTGSGVAAVSPGGSSGTFGTIKAGTNATLPISFTTAPGVSGTLTTTCTIKMANGGTASNPPTCTASPGTFNVSGGSTVTTTLTITTTGSSAALNMPATGAILAGGLLGLLAFFRRRSAIASLLLLLLSLTAMTMITGCAGGGGSSSSAGGGNSGGGTTPTPSTTAGNYTVTVTATIGTQTSSVDLPLTIQ